MLAIFAIVFIGASITMDLTGMSPADQFVVARWGFGGLRIYLWLEAFALAGLVAALGAHVISTGLGVARGDTSRLFGKAIGLDPRMPRQFGYVFVVLGSALVALSLTTLVLFNSCRYMQLV